MSLVLYLKLRSALLKHFYPFCCHCAGLSQGRNARYPFQIAFMSSRDEPPRGTWWRTPLMEKHEKKGQENSSSHWGIRILDLLMMRHATTHSCRVISLGETCDTSLPLFQHQSSGWNLIFKTDTQMLYREGMHCIFSSGAAQHRGSFDASHPTAPGLNLNAPEFCFWWIF